MAPPKLTARKVSEMRRYYIEDKATPADLAEWFGISDATARYHLRDILRPSKAKPRVKISDAQHEEIRRLRADGLSLSELSARFGCSNATILRHAGDVPPPAKGWARPSGPKRKFDYQQAWALMRQGMTSPKIAERYGVSPQAVRKALLVARKEAA